MSAAEEHHENPFLKLSKVLKKDKQQERSQTFTRKVGAASAVSKSALRRRKRRARDELKPQMAELLTTLEETPAVSGYVDTAKPANRNQPNAAKHTGHRRILEQEGKNFSAVLQSPQFRATPFAALKAAIAKNARE
jgi:ribosome biogenesis protein SLX9